MIWFIFYFILLIKINLLCQGFEELVYIESDQCNKNEYFNFHLFKCIPCNSTKHLIASPDKSACVCDSKSKIKTLLGPDGMPECIPCENNQIPSKNQRECIECNSENGSCLSCSNKEISLNQEINGSLIARQLCLTCANGTRPEDDKCVPCPSEDILPETSLTKADTFCPCSSKSILLGGICIPNDILTLWPDDPVVYQVYFGNIKVDSQFFHDYLHSSIYFCKRGNHKACQRVANLCVFVMYHMDKNENDDPFSNIRRRNTAETHKGSPCLLFRSNIPSLGNSLPLPWLFYGEGDAPSVINRNKITAKYSMDHKSKKSRLNITAAIYTSLGDFLGFKSGEDLFSLCSDSFHSNKDGFRFGTPYQRRCRLPISQILRQHNTTLMLDPYLAFEQGGDIHLYALPILITNLKINSGDTWQWQLIRRLMLIDITSGISATSTITTPHAIRYLQSLTIRIRLRDSKGYIFPPLLVARYATLILSSNTEETYINTDLIVEYTMPGDHTAYAIEVSIGVLSALASLGGCLQAWSQARRDGRASAGIDLITLIQVAIHASGHLANSFFLVAAATCIHSCLFFKGQAVPKCLLPKANIEKIVRQYLCVAFSLKLLQIAYLISRQCSVDVFLLDWERPSKSSRENSGDRSVPVSVWRTYLVGNEWAERQALRRIPAGVHLIVALAILELFGLEKWAAAWPELNPPPGTPSSPVCRLTLGVIVIGLCYLVQWLWTILVKERYIKHPMTELVDLCSLANISLFILAHRRYGYYIHGRSVHGSADTDAKQLAARLDAETADVCAGRGLVPGQPHQTFELAVPDMLRVYYDKLMAAAASSSDTNKSRPQSASAPNHQAHIANASQTVNRFLAAFLDHALTDLDYEVREKRFLETLLDVEFADVVDTAFLYTDNGHSFDRVLFFGQELTLFAFELYLFSFIEIHSQNYLLAILITILCDKILSAIRYYGGRLNIAKKTLIDPRFLI